MILGVLLGFAALAVLSSVFREGETETSEAGTEENGMNISGGNQDDILIGGYGDDAIIAGPDNTITHGEGLDDLFLGSRIEGAGPATVTDFIKDEDSLIYLYDAAQAEPELTLDFTQETPDDPLDTLLYANGDLVAVIQGTGGFFTLGDVFLSPVRAQTSVPAIAST